MGNRGIKKLIILLLFMTAPLFAADYEALIISKSVNAKHPVGMIVSVKLAPASWSDIENGIKPSNNGVEFVIKTIAIDDAVAVLISGTFEYKVDNVTTPTKVEVREAVAL